MTVFLRGKRVFCRIDLQGSGEGQGSEKDKMLLRYHPTNYLPKIMETHCDSQQANKTKQMEATKSFLHLRISTGRIILQPDDVLSPSLGPDNVILTNESNFLSFHNERMFQQSTSN